MPIPVRGALALLVALAAPAAAQTLVGTVVEDGTGQPLGGAFVQLVDSTGARVTGVLSGGDGDFVIRAEEPGSYQVVIEIIGHGGARAAVELGAGESVRRTFRVPVEAVRLDGIRASVRERCHRRPGRSAATAALWEEARKALEVTRWAEQTSALRFQVVEHVSELESPSMEVVRRSENALAGFYARGPYRSIPADRLDRGGYVQRAPNGNWDYFAPDAEVLLSDTFLDNHCFRLTRTRSEPGLIGLGIEPVPGRGVPEIEGVLWLEETTAELKRLDFRYVNLPYARADWPQVGGRVEFDRLANGVWVVRRWRLRMPQEAVRGQRGELRLVKVLERGAEIRSVRTIDGAPVGGLP